MRPQTFFPRFIALNFAHKFSIRIISLARPVTQVVVRADSRHAALPPHNTSMLLLCCWLVHLSVLSGTHYSSPTTPDALLDATPPYWHTGTRRSRTENYQQKNILLHCRAVERGSRFCTFIIPQKPPTTTTTTRSGARRSGISFRVVRYFSHILHTPGTTPRYRGSLPVSQTAYSYASKSPFVYSP